MHLSPKGITQSKNRYKVSDPYRSLFDYNPDGTFIINLEGFILEMNKAAEELCGYSYNDYCNKHFNNFIVEDYQTSTLENFEHVKKGNPLSYETAIYHKKGYRVDLYVTAVPIIIDGIITGVIGIASDITEEKKLKRMIKEKEHYFESFFTSYHDAVYTLDLDGKFVSLNDSAVKMIGYQREELLGRVTTDFLYHEDIEKRNSIFEKVIQGEPQTFETSVHHKNGQLIQLEVLNLPMIEDGKVVGIYGVAKDITAKRSVERLTTEANNRIIDVLNSITDGFFTLNRNWVVTFWNRAAEKMTNVRHQEILGENFWNVFKQEEHLSFSNNYKRAMDERIPLDFEEFSPQLNKWFDIRVFPSQEGISVYFKDINETKQNQKKIEYMAYYDRLTGLPNQEYCRIQLEQLINDVKRTTAILYIDIDGFKGINDAWGYNIGNKLMVDVAKRLETCVRTQDVFGRFEGDEFIVILPDTEQNEALAIVQSILKTFEEPFIVDNRTFYMQTYIGVCVFPRHGESVDTLIKKSYMAMRKTKVNLKSSYFLYSEELENEVIKRIQLEHDLHKAIEHQEITLYYQPQTDIKTGQIVGAEALIRWKHRELGDISPLEFIPLAEQTGLITSIGAWVIRKACAQFMEWKAAGIHLKRIAVNLSALQLRQENLVHIIKEILKETNIDPDSLEIEITESMAMEDVNFSIKKLEELRQLGIKISIDDFGTGYSSLAYLRKLPIDTLKIDRSFISDILTSSDNAEIVKMIIALAHQLKLKVLAEGVETEQQLEFLSERGCDEMQGYLISPPVPAQEFSLKYTQFSEY